MKYNKSKTYLLPLLSEVVDFEPKFMKNLLNSYMFYDESDEYKDCLCIIHDFSFKNPEFTSYEHKLTNTKYFVKHIDIGNKVLYIFKFPEEYLDEYYLLQMGRYSEFKEDAKELILRFWNTIYKNNPNAISTLIYIKQVLYKETKLKQKLETDLNVKIDESQELGELIEIESETFKIEEFESNTTKL